MYLTKVTVIVLSLQILSTLFFAMYFWWKWILWRDRYDSLARHFRIVCEEYYRDTGKRVERVTEGSHTRILIKDRI